MVKISLNDEDCGVDTLEELGLFLERLAGISPCELWLTAENESCLCMLRQNRFSWLMHLRYPGDSGFTSIGNIDVPDKAEFTLSNGQVDEYPIAWCIELETALKALSYFGINEGKRPDFIEWRETRPEDEC